ncbi:hypothetical protein CPB86DRAFT_451234 [Serendipita vermifera]|nr:hypothetical protein CPB86DRAFT_451234 [Serendipita vermifera]
MSIIHELPPPFSTLDQNPAPQMKRPSSGRGLSGAKTKQPSLDYFHDSQQQEADVLPPYSNTVRLVTLCRRKREFNVTFEKARKGHRSWDIVWMVLDGTALRLYKPTREEKADYERRFGDQIAQSPCSASTRESATSTPAQSIRSRSSPLSLIRTASSLYPTTTTESTLPTTGHRAQSSSIVQKRLEGTAGHVPPRPDLVYSSSYNVSSNRLAPPNHLILAHACRSTPALAQSSPLSRTMSLSSPAITATTNTPPDFTRRPPIRQYSVRHAICVKADTYIKREHVLRFTLGDGKQFLVQLGGKTEMVAWLQTMSVAAPLALDLDERPMPEPAQYPRTRRRQARPRTAPAALETTSNASGSYLDATLSSSGVPGSTTLSSPIISITRSPSPHPNTEVVGGDLGDNEDESDLEMDHLPPPRQPSVIHSLSSVDEARRRGIQV